MTTQIDEIAPQIFRLAEFVPAANPPSGLTFCEFLIMGDEPLLFHCGHRSRFAGIAAAVAKLMPLERLRWIGYSHAEADESGAVNEWLAAAPQATAFHGSLGCNIWLRDFALRPPRALKDGEALDLGGKTVRYLATPHLPHGWDAGLLYEETTGTLFPSDLFAQPGAAPALGNGDILGPALAMEAAARAIPVTPTTGTMLRRLAGLAPRRLALMHGPTYTGDGAAALTALAEHFDEALSRAAGLPQR